MVARREDDVVGVRIVTVVAFAAVVAGVLSGSATAAPTRDALVRPGEGIGKVQLGMTLGTALRSLRRPVVFVRAEIFPRESLRYLEYRTKDHQWRIGVFGIRGRERVALVRTGVRRERTREGVGVGTPVPMVASRLRPYRPVCNKRYPVVERLPHRAARLLVRDQKPLHRGFGDDVVRRQARMCGAPAQVSGVSADRLHRPFSRRREQRTRQVWPCVVVGGHG